MTSIVDPSSRDLPGYRQAAGSTASQGNRQGWLKAMEAAGLRDALRNTRAFEGGQAGLRMPDGGADRQDAGAGRMQPVEADVSESAVLNRQRLQVEPSIFRVAQGPVPQTAVGHEMPPAVIAGYVVAETREALAARGDAPRAATVPDAALVARKEWSACNLLLLPASGGGIEVWVRDARLSPERIQTLLSDLRRAAAEQGGGPIKLFVNGQPVQPANDGRPRQGD